MQADLERRLEQIIRIGTISEIDHAQALCRVACGNLTSEWLPWLELRSGETRTWNPPTLGEQCLWISPSGNTDGGGCVIAGLYSDNAPSSDGDETLALYPDGASIRYNHATGALAVTGVKTARVQASVSCTLDTPLTTLTGDLIVEGKAVIKGLLSYLAGLAGSGGGAGSVIQGPLTQSDGALSSNGIVLATHAHGGVQPGGSSTGAPQ
ncbi:MAG: phage baseplate assembly protein V [Betaproteobacteria bacterium]|nr:phage baseplate assembly protein V [Betaproteobacteria bacterium]